MTRELLKTTSPFHLSVATIAKAAKTAPGTIYVYFEDVQDLIYALCAEAVEEFAEMIASHPQWFNDATRLFEDCQSLINEFTMIWDKHSHALLYGSLEADRGNPRFLHLRTEQSIPIVNRLRPAIRLAKPSLSGRQAAADAVVLYAAIERLASIRHQYPPARPGPSTEELWEAQARLLATYLAPH